MRRLLAAPGQATNSLYSSFINDLDCLQLGCVLVAELQPLAALEQSWAVLSCLSGSCAQLQHPDNLILKFDENGDMHTAELLHYFQQVCPDLNQEEVLYWFSGIADHRDGGGVLVIMERQSRQADYARTQLFKQTVGRIQHAAQTCRQQAQYDSWLNEVRHIKEQLLPPADLAIRGVEYAVHYRSCVGGGGDYYDVVDLRNALQRANVSVQGSYVAVALCDVSGHGPGAAVEVAMLDAIMRTYRGKPQEGPASVLHYLNRHFFTRHLRGAFVTGVLCHYDAARNRLLWTNAGHLPVIILRKDGAVEVLDDSEGIPVGIDRDSRWISHEAALFPGDAILLMSDGITEALSGRNEQFGFERVTALLREAPELSAQDMVNKVVQALSAHMLGYDEQDDQTLLFLRVLP